MPTASHSHTATAAADVGAIWLRLNDPETWAGLGLVEKIDEADVSSDGTLVGFSWHTSIGPRRITGTANVTESELDEALTLALDAGELVGTISARLAPNGDGSDLTVTVDITSRGGMASLFFPVISEVLGRGLPNQVEEFAASL